MNNVNTLKRSNIKIDDNYKLEKMSFKSFNDLNPESWSGQRMLDEDRVLQLEMDFRENFENFGSFLIRQAFCITIIDDKYYILDGQHRYKALKNIFEESGISFFIPVGTIICDDKKTAEREFFILNTTTPQLSIHMSKTERKIGIKNDDGINDDEIIDDAFDILKMKFTNFTNKKIRPNIHTDSIKEKIKKHNIIKIMGIVKAKELANYMILLHNYYLKKNVSYFTKIAKDEESNVAQETKRIETFYSKISKDGKQHMLGIFKTNSQIKCKSSGDYSRYWIHHLKNIIKQNHKK